MAEQTYEITFDGYWREPNKAGVPAQSGVYCVFECTLNVEEKNLTLHQLIYIGEAENARERIANHDKLDSWNRHVRDGKQLCYSFAPVDQANRLRVEAALIFKHKPLENIEYVSNFPFDRTTIVSKGTAVSLLNTHFTIERTGN